MRPEISRLIASKLNKYMSVKLTRTEKDKIIIREHTELYSEFIDYLKENKNLKSIEEIPDKFNKIVK